MKQARRHSASCLPRERLSSGRTGLPSSSPGSTSICVAYVSHCTFMNWHMRRLSLRQAAWLSRSTTKSLVEAAAAAEKCCSLVGSNIQLQELVGIRRLETSSTASQEKQPPSVVAVTLSQCQPALNIQTRSCMCRLYPPPPQKKKKKIGNRSCASMPELALSCVLCSV